MAKNRYTDAEKWKDVWFSELSNDEKLVWLYILDDCDHAGIWKVNLRLLNFNCNTSYTLTELYEFLNERVSILSEEKWWIKKFCEFQYGVDFLEKQSKPIISAIKILIKEGLIEENSKGMLTLTKELDKSIVVAKDKDQDKDQDQYKEKAKDKVQYKAKVQVKEQEFDAIFNFQDYE